MTQERYELRQMRVGDEELEADAPLIAEELREERDGQDKKRIPSQAKTTLKKAGRAVWLLTCSAGISGLLFGYDTGVISATLVSIGSDLSDRDLTTTDKSLITAVTSLFALLSAPTTGYFADKHGRKSVILLASVLFVVGALIQAAAGYVWLMVAGRAAVGAAVGLASCATPLYITELAPAELRGRMVTIQSLFITGGQVVAYIIGWLLARRASGWRWMVGIGAGPAILQMLLLVFMYETPRWLVQHEKTEHAYAVLRKVYGGLDEHDRERTVNSVVREIESEIATEDRAVDNGLTGKATATTTLSKTFRHLTSYAPHRRALIIACMLQAIQQFCGFNSLMYFSATIFQLVGFTNPIGISMIVAGTNFVFTIAAFAFIDTFGRRRILLYSIPFMVIGLAACSAAFQFIGPFDTSTPANNVTWGGVLIAAMMVYVSSYAIGLGCVPWQQSELFPLRVRSLGSGIATATNWSSNFIIGITFLPMMNLLGATTTFATYALICICGWIAIFAIYPETAGLELEAVGQLLKDGFGVRESVERFLARKHKLEWEAVPTDHEDDHPG